MVNIKSFVFGTVETNCYIISDSSKNCVIVDCDGDGKEIFKYVDDNGLKPIYILLTHGHFDHVGAVNAVKSRYGCKVCIGEFEEEILASSIKYNSKQIEVDVKIKDSETVLVGDMNIVAINTPGHTKGSLCYIIEDYIISGDTLFFEDCGRTDLFTGNWEDMKKSLHRLRDLSGDYKVLPGHGSSTTMNHERSNNQYMNQE